MLYCLYIYTIKDNYSEVDKTVKYTLYLSLFGAVFVITLWVY